MKNQIPIRTGFWDVSQPGFMEADTVAQGVLVQIKDVEAALPFVLLGFDCDM